MKLKQLSYIAAAIALTGFTACDDFLDAAPDERVTIDTPEKVSLLLVDAYPGGTHDRSIAKRRSFPTLLPCRR